MLNSVKLLVTHTCNDASILFVEDLSSGHIVYDNNAIEALLDRSKEGIVDKEGGMDEYLSSFKVCF